jgi:hypothetical protein
MGFLKAAPGPSVVLADESLSSRIPALTGHYVVATSYSHDPVADWEARRSLVRAALSRGHDWAEVRAGLDRYGVDYVVATPGPETEEPIRRLDGHPERFRRCYEGEGVVIWRRLA